MSRSFGIGAARYAAARFRLTMGSNNSVDGRLSQMYDVGTVAPGRRADLIARRGNPVTDLSALHDVAHLMADGNEVA